MLATAKLLVLGAAVGASAAEAVPAADCLDAVLISMCERIVAANEEAERLEEPYHDQPCSPPHVAERASTLVAEGHRLSEEVAFRFARTPEGVRAKARALLTYVILDLDDAPEWDNHDELLGWSIARDLAGRAVSAAPVAVPALARAEAGPDAQLVAVCTEHVATRDAYNNDPNALDREDDPLQLAYDRTRDAISEARPQTLEGVLAKARVAKVEARNPDGSEEAEGSVAARWAWDTMNDLLRLYGRA